MGYKTYNHFISTDVFGVATKIKQITKKREPKKRKK